MAEAADDAAKPARDPAADEKTLDLARKRFAIAVSAEDENRGKELDDLKFAAASPDDNWQWPQDVLNNRTQSSQEGGARPCMTMNVLPQHIRQVTNEQRMNRVQMKVHPVNDGADAKVAKIYNGFLRHIWVASEADLASDQACDAQVTSGVGFFRVLTEFVDEMSFDQEIRIAALPDRFKVYLDPHGVLLHPAGKKCRWGFVIEDLPEEEYLSLYGEENAFDWNEAGTGDHSHWRPAEKVVRVAEYLEVVEKEKTICLWEDGKVTTKGDPMDARYLAMGAQPVKERKTRIPRCMWRKMNGQKVLLEREMPTKYLPIVRVVGNQWIIEGKAVVSGLTRNAKDAQRSFNYNVSMEAELNGLAPKAPFIGYDQQFEGFEDDWKRVNQAPLAYLKVALVMNEVTGEPLPLPMPQRMQPIMPQIAILQAKAAALDHIKATTGQYNPTLGQQGTATSGKQEIAQQRQGDVGTYHFVDNFARAVRYACTIAIDMIPNVIDTARALRILGEDGEPDHVQIDPDQQVPVMEIKDETGKVVKTSYNLALGKYDLVVSTGPSFTTRRQEAAEFLTSAVSNAKDPASANVLTYLAIKEQDWAGAEEAVSMLKKLLPPQVQEPDENDGDGQQPQIPPQVAQMIDQIKQMAGHTKGQLDAAQQALAERDQKLRSLESEIKGKNMDAYAKMYDADMKALSEITRARSEVLIAQAKALEIQAQQPDNAQVQAVTQALGHFAGEMDAKIAALTESAGQIKSQLENFEIAGRIQQQGAPT